MTATRVLRGLVSFVAGIALVGGGALFVYKRLDTGKWSVPTGNDLVEIKSRISPHSRWPSKIIFLNRDPVTLSAGPDDAPHGVSSVVASTGQLQVRMPGFRGSAKDWRWITRCVQKKFGDFDVVVTDTRPQQPDYIMVAVGGRARELGKKHAHDVGGLAPFNSSFVPNAVVFVFARSLRQRKREICEVIGMEVGHAYGLDHGYDCRDLMTYLPYCGYKRFQDKNIPCGEKKKRVCASGRPTQNSYRRLFKVLGPKK